MLNAGIHSTENFLELSTLTNRFYLKNKYKYKSNELYIKTKQVDRTRVLTL
jgi:hypothetical protein